MITIQISVSEDMILAIEKREVEDFLQKQTQVLRLQLLAECLDKFIADSGVDSNAEPETAWQEAYHCDQS